MNGKFHAAFRWLVFGIVSITTTVFSMTEKCPRSLLGHELSVLNFPYLDGHAIRASNSKGRNVVVPGAALLSMMLEELALRDPSTSTPSSLFIKGLRIQKPVLLSDKSGNPQTVRLSSEVVPKGESFDLSLSSQDEIHVSGTGSIGKSFPARSEISPEILFPLETFEINQLYSKFEHTGLMYKPPFKHALNEVYVFENFAVGTVSLDAALVASNRLLDPVILDGCFHALGAIYFKANPKVDDGKIAIPTLMSQVYFNPDALKNAPRQFVCLVETKTIPDLTTQRITFDLHLNLDDDAGTPVLFIKNGTALRVDPFAL